MEVFEDSYSHQFIETNGINLHVVLAGPEEGEMVIFLHGFPEFWYGCGGARSISLLNRATVWLSLTSAAIISAINPGESVIMTSVNSDGILSG